MTVKKPNATPAQVRKKAVKVPRSRKAKLDAAQEALATYYDTKLEAEAAAERKAEAQAELLEILQRTGLGSVSIVDESRNVRVTGTSVESVTTDINEEGLRKALGAAVWNKVTKKVLDKKKLEAAVATGDVRPTIVAANSSVVPRAPYVKVTEKAVG